MALGLGTGSTTTFAVEQLGERFAAGQLQRIVAVPTSNRTAALARRYGIPLRTLAEQPELDLAIDGADEVDPRLDLIKGLGGALLREKEVERVARRFIVIVDESKLVARLGTRAPLPVEVAVDAEATVWPFLVSLGATVERRGGATPFVTDNGNHVLDARFSGGIDEPARLAESLDAAAGIRAHGLFLEMADEVIIAAPGGVRVLRRE
jgi:ribose 5-phosphate isomerase A